ncbi:MoaD/ThiS family protein [Eubacteriaceae bacterium ES3]|nr:MoaD/ThiS family protein [Eubacteriaceae bacterium ES3]
MVLVEYKGELAKLTGKSEESLSATSLEGLLLMIKKNYSKEVYQTAKRCHITINGKISHQKLIGRLLLNENDRVVFFPVCSGG